jgi:dephospho-CoA kinase
MKSKILGITGLPCVGKSEISLYLSTKPDTFLVDADQLGHFALAEGDTFSTIYHRLKEIKISILDKEQLYLLNQAHIPSGLRKDLGRIVFKNPKALAIVEEVLHPRITELFNSMVGMADNKKIILDAALLYQMGMDNRCNEIWRVESPAALRLQRAIARGWTEEDLKTRSERQMERKYFGENDVIVTNDGSKNNLFERVECMWKHFINSD